MQVRLFVGGLSRMRMTGIDRSVQFFIQGS
jgi:hypothetical protein